MKTKQNSNTVFISYRRNGGDTMAQLLNDRLCGMGYNVFYDIDSIKGGDFENKLEREVGNCTDFIILLSPGVFDRCGDPEDFVRREVALALQMGKNIVPVLMRDFVFPENLPEDIRRITLQDGVTIENMQLLDAKIQELTVRLVSKRKPFGKKDKPSKEEHGRRILIGLAAAAVLIGGMAWTLISIGKQAESYSVVQKLTDFTTECNELDVDGIMRSIDPEIAEPVAWMFELLQFGGIEKEQVLSAIYTIIFDDADGEADDFFGSVHAEIEKVRMNFKKATVEAEVSYTVAGYSFVKNGEIHFVKEADEWYISGFEFED